MSFFSSAPSAPPPNLTSPAVGALAPSPPTSTKSATSNASLRSSKNHPSSIASVPNSHLEDTVRRLASAKRFKWIEEILEDEKQYADFSNEGFAVPLVKLYGRMPVLDEMPEKNCERTVLSFNAPWVLVLTPRILTRRFVKWVRWIGGFDEMEKKGVESDMIMFNTIMNGSYNARLLGLASEKKTDEAVELLKEMRNKEVKPDVLSINALIKGFVNEGKLEEAKQWYRELALVPFVCERGDLDFAFELGDKIFKGRLLVDVELLQTLVDGIANASRINDAKKIVRLGNTNTYLRYNLQLPSEE
ncbi:hypothetical protein FF1_005088 [Malus domestica]